MRRQHEEQGFSFAGADGVRWDGGVGVANPGPPLIFNVRDFHKRGLLGDETAVFGLKWSTGDEIGVAAERENVHLRYRRGDEEVAENISVAWSNDKPWFTCALPSEVL